MTSRPPPRTSITRSRCSVRTSRNSMSERRSRTKTRALASSGWNWTPWASALTEVLALKQDRLRLPSQGQDPGSLTSTSLSPPPAPQFKVQDTIFITVAVAGRPRHVEQHELGVPGFLHNDLVQPHGRVHAPHVGLVPAGGRCGEGSLSLKSGELDPGHWAAGPQFLQPGTTNPRPLQPGLFGEPRGQGHELRGHDIERRVGTLANAAKRIKNSEALTSSPTPFRKHKRSKEEGKRGVRQSRGGQGPEPPSPTLTAPWSGSPSLHLSTARPWPDPRVLRRGDQDKVWAGSSNCQTRARAACCSAVGSTDPVGSP